MDWLPKSWRNGGMVEVPLPAPIPLPESPNADGPPEFEVVTTVELMNNGGFDVKASLSRRHRPSNKYQFILGFREECMLEGLETAKASVNRRADRHIEKLKNLPPEEVRYVE